MQQRLLTGEDQYVEFDKWISGKKLMVVCGKSFHFHQKTKDVIASHSDTVFFSDYEPNPQYKSVVEGVRLFQKEKCDAVVAVGGGSCIDVAKCIRLFAEMDPDGFLLDRAIVDNEIPFLAVPTTAGTGSEATKYAVIYLDGNKQSVSSIYCVPDTVLLDPDNLSSLPDYQRKATMMDAFSHALESMWSVNSTKESKEYSSKAIGLIIPNIKGYLRNKKDSNILMQQAAYFAGKAINITQTTAGHAMCYKITSMFGCAHGHAVALCNKELFPWMIDNMDKCVDPRGKQHLKDTFSKLSHSLGAQDEYQSARIIKDIVLSMEFDNPHASDEQIEEMVSGVNKERLKNNPICLDKTDIEMLYRRILSGKEE